MKTFKLDWLILPLLGAIVVIVGWHVLAGKKVVTKDADGNVASEERHGVIPDRKSVV